jgi:dihydrofolate reductase
MRKLKMEMQVSLDGYAIGADGGGDWMVWNWSDDWTWDAALRVFHIELITSSDCILLSRQMVEDGFIEHWEEVATRGDDPQVAMAQPVVDMRKVVFSKSLRSVDKPHCELVRGDVVSEVTKLKEQPGKDLIVYGGPTFVSSLMEAELIDEVHLVVNPVLIGAGVTPFKFLAHHVALRPLEPRRFDCGVVVLSYETVPRSPHKRDEATMETPGCSDRDDQYRGDASKTWQTQALNSRA